MPRMDVMDSCAVGEDPVVKNCDSHELGENYDSDRDSDDRSVDLDNFDVELMSHLKDAWCWPLEGRLYENESVVGVVPNVENLASWMIDNDDWLPKPTRDGANRTRSSSTRLQAEKVWHQIPEGLRIWCVQFEPGMWNGQNAEMLQVLEEIVVSECAQVELMDEEVQQSTQLSPQYSSMALRHAVVKRMVACGMQAENCRFVLEERFGFDADFAKVEYEWNADRSHLQWVMSIVDKFVTLMMGHRRPTNMRWCPTAEIVDSADWRAGGVHEPEAVRNWEKLYGISSWVLDWVRNKFYAEPTERVMPTERENARYLDPSKPRHFDAERFAFTDEKLKKDEKLGVLQRLGPDCRPDNVNRISLAPKNSATEPWRVCGDMRPINKKYKNRKMKYETLRHVPMVLDPGDFSFVLDLKAAYHSVFAQERLARQWGLKWRGIYRKWLSLPFGFILSPWCFSKMMRQVVKHCRALRRKILQFLDDGLGGASDFVTAVMHRNEMIVLLHSLGFRCSAKSSPLPERTTKFLGVIIHTASPSGGSFHIPQDKIEVLQKMMTDAVMDTGSWTMRKAAKITGKLLSMSLAIPATRLMSRELYACMHSNKSGDWDAHIASTPEALHELKWLLKCLAPWNDDGYPIWVDTHVTDFDITADASPIAGGFKVSDAHTHKITQLSTVFFRPEEAELAQCHREMWILCLLVRGLCRQLNGRRIRVRVDAMTTRSYWRNGGGRSKVLTDMTKLLWATCVQHRISIVDIVHIPGTQMVDEHVDALSRPVPHRLGSELDREEWMLSKTAFQHIQSHFSVQFSVDRFASRVNRQCSRFNSKRWEPEAEQPASAFAHDWHAEWNFCHPPLRLVPQVLAHAKKQKAWICLVVPRWPSQPWWPGLCAHMSSMLFLGRSDKLLCRLVQGRYQPVRRPPFELVAVVCQF